jgi:hypothetical protein
MAKIVLFHYIAVVAFVVFIVVLHVVGLWRPFFEK